MKFKTGDKVKLQKNSLYHHQSEGKSGVIININGRHDGFCYNIRWENGRANDYKEEDIFLSSSPIIY